MLRRTYCMGSQSQSPNIMRKHEWMARGKVPNSSGARAYYTIPYYNILYYNIVSYYINSIHIMIIGVKDVPSGLA